MTPENSFSLEAAARSVREAEALLIAAGAGMGVDSGLPDFRGTEGFWKAYPPFARLGLRFEQLANPTWFARDPELAWGFYGHRLNLYRATTPHPGFDVLRRWAGAKRLGAFVFTSNVDGQFQKAGFPEEAVAECHGSVHQFQCAAPCCEGVWPAPGSPVTLDEATMRAAGALPACPTCGGVARPNVLMFGDGGWLSDPTDAQLARYRKWLERADGARVVVVECGAGTSIPTVRLESERIARRPGATLVRINLREPQVPTGPHVGLPLGAAAALAAIDRLLDSGAPV